PLGARMQRSRPRATPVGIFCTDVAVSRAASTAPFATWLAPPLIAPTTAPTLAPTLATPRCIKSPTAVNSPGAGCKGCGAGSVTAGAGWALGGGLGVCARPPPPVTSAAVQPAMMQRRTLQDVATQYRSIMIARPGVVTP